MLYLQRVLVLVLLGHEPGHAPLILGPSWMHRPLETCLIALSNAHFGKRSIARDLTIFGFHVGAHVSESMNSY